MDNKHEEVCEDKEFNEAIDENCEMSNLNIDNKSLHDEVSLNKLSCDFGDTDCGAPISMQRIVLDFTPIEDLDNDDVQRKCCEFWDFVNSRPELNSLIVQPRPKTVTSITKSDDVNSVSNHTISTSTIAKDETAVSVLEFVEEKGLISRAFNSKMVNPFCEEELKDYSDEDVLKINKARNGDKKKTTKKHKTPNVTTLQTCVSASNMCEKLHEWDLKHPKSFSPPGPVPTIEDSVLSCKDNL